MKIGTLNERIVFLAYLQGARGLYNEVDKTWITSNEIWANVDFKQGNEEALADRITEVSIAVFTVRLMEGVESYMRIKHGKKHYNIKSIYLIDKTYMSIRAEATEPIQYTQYWTDPTGQPWTDPTGQPWEWSGDGLDVQPEKQPNIAPGGLTWKDQQGNIFYQP